MRLDCLNLLVRCIQLDGQTRSVEISWALILYTRDDVTAQAANCDVTARAANCDVTMHGLDTSSSNNRPLIVTSKSDIWQDYTPVKQHLLLELLLESILQTIFIRFDIDLPKMTPYLHQITVVVVGNVKHTALLSATSLVSNLHRIRADKWLIQK